jgi:AcrR family transcriptional regulator
MSETANHSGGGEGRRERRRRELHERIFRTTRKLFIERGFGATTVEQIAAVADIAPATFFNHFPSKDAVLREMAGEVFERFGALLETQRKRSVSTLERVRGFASHGAAVVTRNPELTRDLLLEVLRSSAAPGAAAPQLARMREQFAALFEDGKAQGDVRPDLDVDFLAELSVSVFHGTLVNWMHDERHPLRKRMLQNAEFLGEAALPRDPPPDD